MPPHPQILPYHLTTVSWIVSTRDNMDVDDHYVTLIGRIHEAESAAMNGDFDGSPTAPAPSCLDGGDFDLPIGPEKSSVGGRIDQAYFGLGHLEVDVKHWHPAKTPGKPEQAAVPSGSSLCVAAAVPSGSSLLDSSRRCPQRQFLSEVAAVPSGSSLPR